MAVLEDPKSLALDELTYFSVMSLLGITVRNTSPTKILFFLETCFSLLYLGLGDINVCLSVHRFLKAEGCA